MINGGGAGIFPTHYYTTGGSVTTNVDTQVININNVLADRLEITPPSGSSCWVTVSINGSILYNNGQISGGSTAYFDLLTGFLSSSLQFVNQKFWCDNITVTIRNNVSGAYTTGASLRYEK